MRLDAIYSNGHFRTLDPARPTATALGVFAGRIVGFDEELEGATADVLVDLEGAHALPGFHDAHFHLSLTGARLAALDLRPTKVSSLAQLYAAVEEFSATLPEGAWVRASGYDQNFLEGHPTAEGLDAVTGGRPAILEHVSGHMVVVNTAAFEAAGHPGRAGVPDMDGGTVARDVDGLANGLLQERAMVLAYALVRPMPLDEVQRNLGLAAEQAARYGLTSVTEPGCGDANMLGNTPADFHSYQQAVEANVLRSRVTLMPYCTTLHQLEGFKGAGWFGLDLGIRTGLGDDRLRVGPVKIVSDGSFIGRSAAMHHCYHGEPENLGVMQFDPKELRNMIVGAHESGWQVAAHAIGDAAIDHVLDAFQEAQERSPRAVRHRIEHFAYTSEAQVERAAALGAIPVPQGVFISDFGDGMRDAVQPQEGERIYRMRSLLDAGMVLPGSSDSPVSDGNPLVSIHDMVNRVTASGAVLEPEERISVEEAVYAYTYGSAYAVHQEGDKGTLERGKLADFVVLSADLFEVEPAAIKEQRVLRTVIGGRTVFTA